MYFLSMLAFSFFIAPGLSMRILDSDIDFPGLITPEGGTLKDDTVVGPDGTLRIMNDYIAPDGYKRSATLVNGVFPAPLIKANKGEMFNITVENRLTDRTMPLHTSVHFHGIFQRESNWADGVAYVTQCPLRPGESFTHKFEIGNQTGTYWYHSHYKAQYCDGLRGPLVIYDQNDPLKCKSCKGDNCYDVDDENTVITLAEWYHNPSPPLDKIFPVPPRDSILINGKGRYASGPLIPLSVVKVKYGSRYRFRVVSMACNPTFNFAIDGHPMTIIEVDGIEVDPVTVDMLPIFPGQRYSVVITANQDKKMNYWIRGRTDLPNVGGINSAILRYDDAPDEDPTSPPDQYKLPFDESKLHPVINPGAPGVPGIGKADVNLVLRVGNTSNERFTMNDVSFDPPSMPVLLQILSGRRKAWELMPQGSIYLLPKDKVVEISFPNPALATDGPHPMHLHGHAFDVVRVAGSTKTNFMNPVRRDVVSLGKNPWDNVVIRFRTDNPGPWLLHCHIDWHLTHGMAVVMAEAPDETDEEQREVIPKEWWDLCPAGQDWGQIHFEESSL